VLSSCSFFTCCSLIANSFDKPIGQGGLAVGDLQASAVLAVLIIISIFLIPQRPAMTVGKSPSCWS
jgi:hypothetical protein